MKEPLIQLDLLPKMKMSWQAKMALRWQILRFFAKRALYGCLSDFDFSRLILKASLALLIPAMLIIPIYSYFADSLDPAGPLYSLKRGIERLEMFAATERSKPELYLKLADRRLKEATALARRQADEATIVKRIGSVAEAQELAIQAEKKSSDSPNDRSREQQRESLKIKETGEINNIIKDVSLDMKDDTIERTAKLLIRNNPIAADFKPEVILPDETRLKKPLAKEPNKQPVDSGQPSADNHGRQPFEAVSSTTADNSFPDRIASIRRQLDKFKASSTGLQKVDNAKRINALLSRVKDMINESVHAFVNGNINDSYELASEAESLYNLVIKLSNQGEKPEKGNHVIEQKANGNNNDKQDRSESKNSGRVIIDGNH